MAKHTGNAAADKARARITECSEWIVFEHMTELQPLIWAHAAHGFDNALRIRSLDSFAKRGVAEARSVLTTIFRPELTRGENVIFTKNGPEMKLP